MSTYIYLAIIFFGLSSYIVGIWQMLNNRYQPSTFSRIIWVLLAINSFAGLLLSNSSKPSILLGAIFLLGNIAICILSFWKGVFSLGKLEYISIVLLVISGLIWIFFSAPIINVVISLLAHFIGGAPTYKKIWQDPASESFGFWSLFFIASLLSIFASDSTSIIYIIFPIYFTIFDGSMSLLSLRKIKNFSI